MHERCSHRLKIRHRITRAMPTPYSFVSEHVETQRRVIKNPPPVKQRASGNAERRTYGQAAEIPLARNRQLLPGHGLWHVRVIPVIALPPVVTREWQRVAGGGGTIS